MPIGLKSGSPQLLEPLGPVQACNGIALPLPLHLFTSRGTAQYRGSYFGKRWNGILSDESHKCFECTGSVSVWKSNTGAVVMHPAVLGCLKTLSGYVRKDTSLEFL